MSRPSRDLAPVDYAGQDEDAVQPVKKQKTDDSFSDLGFGSASSMKKQADTIAAFFDGSREGASVTTTTATKVAPIFAPSPVASSGKQSAGVKKPGKAKATGGYEMHIQKEQPDEEVRLLEEAERPCEGMR